MIFLGLLALIASASALPVTTEQKVYKIQQDIKDISYDLALTLNEMSKDKTEFTGEVTITFTIDKDLDKLQLHADGLTFNSLVLNQINSDTNPTEIAVKHGDVDPDTQIFEITREDSTKFVTNSVLQLTIQYTGKLRDDMNGFYLSSYMVADTEKYIASTQFESTYARYAFPCFDEPELKAVFTVKITCPAEYNTVLSNGKLKEDIPSDDKKLHTVTFEPSPIMSTYLLAFVVSEYKCNYSEDDEKFYSVCALPDVLDSTKLALEVAPRVLEEMKSYTGVDYKTKMKHLQQIGIPDFEAGAMENFGLITYREADFLWSEDDSLSYKQKVATVVAHELAHQWFGDIVTLDWWSDTFLNEGFATFFEYFITQNIYDDMELDKQFVLEELQPALSIDSASDSPALHLDVETPLEISQHFDSISYNKGGSILRMIKNFIKDDKFRAGLNNYVKAKAGKNAKPEDLWEALQDTLDTPTKVELPDTISAIMENWINKAGYPLIHVTLDDDKLSITQEQFLDSGEGSVTWFVPITYTTSKEKNNEVQWLKPSDKSLTISGVKDADWIVVNNQQTGYYRVDYDKTLLNKLSTALSDSKTLANIDELNRAEIVDDLLNLAKVGKKEYNEVLNFLGFLKNEDSYYPWYSTFREFNNILKRIDQEIISFNLKQYFLDLMKTLLDKIKFNNDVPENHIEVLRKALALNWACKLNNEECIKYAQTQFATYKENKDKKVNSNYRSVVYCTAIANSTNPTEDFDFLWSTYDSVSSADQNIILKSLGCATDKTKLESYVNEIITKIRKQDVSTAFNAVMAGSKTGVETVITYINKNSESIFQNLGEKSFISLINLVADYITNQEQSDTLFIDSLGTLSNSVKEAVEKAKTKTTANLQKTKQLEDTFTEYFKDNGATQIVVQLSTFVLTIVVTMYNLL